MPADKLTPKQERFCQEYLVDLNATQAAIRAGYSERTARQIAAENLAKPNIMEFIEAARKRAAENADITLQWLLDQARGVLADARDDRSHAAAINAIKELGVLSGERVEKSETAVVSHEDRLVAIREKLNRDQPTKH